MDERGELHPTGDASPEMDLPADFWDNAQVEAPKTKTSVTLRVDPDILEFFKEDGRGYQTRIHSVLRSYVNAQRRHTP
jgi:uncharacterized protein (DUF4415 family)